MPAGCRWECRWWACMATTIEPSRWRSSSNAPSEVGCRRRASITTDGIAPRSDTRTDRGPALGTTHRQAKDEGAPDLLRPRHVPRLDVHVPTVRLGDVLDQREPDAAAAHLSILRALAPV